MDKQKKANQRLVNEAWKHLSQTNRKSERSGECIYVGTGCAFSVAIKKRYRDDLDPATPREFSPTAEGVMSGYPGYLKKWAIDCCPVFAGKVQKCHDLADSGRTFLDSFREALKDLCDDNDIKYPWKDDA